MSVVWVLPSPPGLSVDIYMDPSERITVRDFMPPILERSAKHQH